MKVLHVFSKLDRGGAEIRTVKLGEELKKEGIIFDYLCLSGMEGELDQQLIQEGSKIHYLKLKDWKFPFKYFLLLKKNKYEVVHSHVHFTSGFIHLISSLAKVKNKISHFRSTGNGKKNTIKNRLSIFILKELTLLSSTKILFVSNAVKDSLFKEDIINDRSYTIYNGFDEEDLCRDDNNFSVPTILSIGRMIPDKNYIRVLEIFNEMLKLKPELNLKILGRSNELIKEDLGNYISKHGISNKVSFEGEVKSVKNYFSNSILLLSPSRREGLPGSIIESSLNGVPVLGSSIEPIKEVGTLIDGISTLSLEKTNKEWALVAIGIIDKSNKCVITYDERLKKLKESPFEVKNVAQLIYKIYRGL